MHVKGVTGAPRILVGGEMFKAKSTCMYLDDEYDMPVRAADCCSMYCAAVGYLSQVVELTGRKTIRARVVLARLPHSHDS